MLVAICGLAWFAIYNVALNAAERRVDAGTAAMLINVGPILIALLAGALLGEGFPRWLLIGAGVAFTGAVLIGTATARTASSDIVGVLLCLLAALSWAIGVLAQKPALRRLPALQVTQIACTIGAVICLPFAGQLVDDVPNASAGSLAGIVYLGLVPTGVAFCTWAYALSRMNAGRLGVATYLVPPLAIAIRGRPSARRHRRSPWSEASSRSAASRCRGATADSPTRWVLGISNPLNREAYAVV
jgi:drug/metabolite transporter (DMT)-like permease